MTSGTRPARASLTKQALWLLVAKTAGFIIAFIFPLVLVRLLDTTNYGLYKQIFLVISNAQSILPLNFGLSVFFFFPREPVRRPQFVLNVLIFNSTVGALTGLALWMNPGILAWLFGSNDLLPYAGWIGLAIFVRLLSAFLEVVATANEDVAMSTAFIIGAQFTRSALMLFAALYFTSLWALIAASIAQSLLQIAVMIWYISSRFPGWLRGFEWPLFRRQMEYALPLGLASVVYLVQSEAHNYFVAHRFSAAAYAIYAVGCAQIPFVYLLRESVTTVLISRVSALQQNGDTHQIIALTLSAMRKLAAAYWPAYVFLLLTGRDLIALLYTRAYLDSWPIFAVNLTLLPLTILVLDPVVRAYPEHRYYLLKLRIALLGFLLLALYFGVQYFGMIAAIGVVVIGTAIELIAVAWRAIRTLDARAQDLASAIDVLLLAVAATLAAVPAYLAHQWVGGVHPLAAIAITGLVYGPFYIAMVLALRIPEKGELLQMNAFLWRVSRKLQPGRVL